MHHAASTARRSSRRRPRAAIALADDLARLMDDMTTREVPWDHLYKLVPDDLDQHWQLSLEFLKFIHPAWRNFLAENGVIEPAERRDRLIEAEAQARQQQCAGDRRGFDRLDAGDGETARHHRAAAAGAVVLPGLDTTLDEPSWQRIAGADGDATHNGLPASGHPQFAMQALLARIGVPRVAVEPLASVGARGARL